MPGISPLHSCLIAPALHGAQQDTKTSFMFSIIYLPTIRFTWIIQPTGQTTIIFIPNYYSAQPVFGLLFEYVVKIFSYCFACYNYWTITPMYTYRKFRFYIIQHNIFFDIFEHCDTFLIRNICVRYDGVFCIFYILRHSFSLVFKTIFLSLIVFFDF